MCRGKSDRALGKPKKGGAGGKFNWGAKIDYDVSSTTKDPHDPNYDSAEEVDEPLQLRPSTTHGPGSNKQVNVHPLQLSILALPSSFFNLGNASCCDSEASIHDAKIF